MSTKRKKKHVKLVILEQISYFGEEEILRKVPNRLTSAKVISEKCEIHQIPKNVLIKMVFKNTNVRQLLEENMKKTNLRRNQFKKSFVNIIEGTSKKRQFSLNFEQNQKQEKIKLRNNYSKAIITKEKLLNTLLESHSSSAGSEFLLEDSPKTKKLPIPKQKEFEIKMKIFSRQLQSREKNKIKHTFESENSSNNVEKNRINVNPFSQDKVEHKAIIYQLQLKNTIDHILNSHTKKQNLFKNINYNRNKILLKKINNKSLTNSNDFTNEEIESVKNKGNSFDFYRKAKKNYMMKTHF